MLIFSRILLACITLCLCTLTYSNENQPSKTIKINDQTLYLNGYGYRKKLLVNVYQGALYLEKKNNQADTIIHGTTTSTINLLITSNLITREKMIKAIHKGFKNSGYDTKQLDSEIKQFINCFKDEIKKGDDFQFSYLSEQGLHISKNQKVIYTTKNHDFKKALYSIWLGKKPAQKSLQQAMLNL